MEDTDNEEDLSKVRLKDCRRCKLLSKLLFYLAIIWFMMSLTVVVLGDPNPVHDKFYGYLLFLVLQFLTGFILYYAIGLGVIIQISSIIMGLI